MQFFMLVQQKNGRIEKLLILFYTEQYAKKVGKGEHMVFRARFWMLFNLLTSFILVIL